MTPTPTVAPIRSSTLRGGVSRSRASKQATFLRGTIARREMDELHPSDPWADLTDESLEVLRRRYQEGRMAGLSIVEARLFAESDQDIGWLRRLVAGGCPRALIAKIVI